MIIQKFYCHNCNAAFQIIVPNIATFDRFCVECGCLDKEKIQYKGVAIRSKYEVTYTWEVTAYSHEEAKEAAKKSGFSRATGMGTRIRV